MSEKFTKVTEKDVIEMNQNFEALKEMLDTKSTETGQDRERIEKLENQIDAIDVQIQRGVNGLETKSEDSVNDEYNKVFEKFLRKGFNDLDEMEKKTMISSNDTTGGFLTSPDKLSEFIDNVTEMSPIREIARNRKTSKNSVIIPVRNGDVTGGAWVSEIGTRSDLSNPTYKMLEIPVHELAGYVDVSVHNLDDSDYNLEQEIFENLREQFAVTEGGVFVSGNGVNKPQGILTNSDVGEVANGHASELQADALIDMYFELKTPYLRNAKFLLERASIKTIRKLKDGSGRYLWTPASTGDLAHGKGGLILDLPYVEAVDMPTIAANAYPIAIGDFSQGYMVVDREFMAIKRDDYTQMANRTVRFYAFRRVGGQVIKPEAIKKLKIATSV
jgi:HK97 family phage major capsid protein